MFVSATSGLSGFQRWGTGTDQTTSSNTAAGRVHFHEETTDRAIQSGAAPPIEQLPVPTLNDLTAAASRHLLLHERTLLMNRVVPATRPSTDISRPYRQPAKSA